MKSIALLSILLGIVHCLTYFRLDSKGNKTLKAEDSLISTFGLFKMTLKKTNCKLSIQKFNETNNKYIFHNESISSTYNQSCDELRIGDGKIYAKVGEENQREYLTVGNFTYNHSNTLTIDDQGIIRLITTRLESNLVDTTSEELIIDIFKEENSYIKAYSDLLVSFSDRFPVLSNKRDWKFKAELGQLTISYGPDPSVNKIYVYSSLEIRDTRIYDFNQRTFPGVIFTNITFEPRCFEPKIYLDFKPPFVFVADPYWPSVAVYDQGGYKIIQITYSKLSEYSFGQDKTEVNYHSYFSFCPPKTFEHRGDCLNKCPSPYYHLMKGDTGKCVLVCEEYSSVDEVNRTCGCVGDYEKDKISLSDLVISCPIGAVDSPYGCICEDIGKYFDGLYTFDCVSDCPNGTFAEKGVCMKCPQNCKICEKDDMGRLFLKCKNCQSGFIPYIGQCISSCNKNMAKSMINGQCKDCADPNCTDCSDDPNICKKCSLLTSLSNNVCVSKNYFISAQCNPGLMAVYSRNFSTHCVAKTSTCFKYIKSHYKNKPFLKCDECPAGKFMHLDSCVDSCPSGFTAFNNYCVCEGSKNLTIYDECRDDPACPITMYFDTMSRSCLSCPFGCTSCHGRSCTSCNPGYFLYISPQVVICRRKSPLYPCDKQYSWQSNACLVKEYNNTAFRMRECVGNVGNCKVCRPGSDSVCFLCEDGFYLLNNSCIQQCSDPLIPYQNVCILSEIKNCSKPYLYSIHQESVVTYSKMDNSHSYEHYIVENTSPIQILSNSQFSNDPVGYIPYFQQLTERKNDGIPRENSFFEPIWKCLKCVDGYGLNAEMNNCSVCSPECVDNLCYYASNSSCITKKREKDDPVNPPVCYIDQTTGKCVASCGGINFPEIKDGQLYCTPNSSASTRDYAKIDASVYENKDGTKTVLFVFNNKLQETGADVPIEYLGGVSRANFKVSQGNESSPPDTVSIENGEYIYIDEGELGETYGGYEINMADYLKSLSESGSDSTLVFPNVVYGTVASMNHQVFMKEWLAYIGYIMSIVILILHFVFIGNELLYKMDNLLIFVQSIFYFSFTRNLVGRLLSQFYYGWSFAHASFLPNLFEGIIPDHYLEFDAPISYKLVKMDGNYFRNAGFSLAWLLIYFACYLIVLFFVYVIIYKAMKRTQAWYERVAKQAAIAGFEFFSMNLLFFSVAQLRYGSNHTDETEKFREYFDQSQALAIFTFVIISLYTILRINFNKQGGIYMLKRFWVAIVLALAYEQYRYLIPIVGFEIIFIILRKVLEKPQPGFQTYTIVGEGILIIGGYLLMFLCLDAGVNTIIISIIVFIFLVYLSYDLTTLYLESRDEFPEEEVEKAFTEERRSSYELGEYGGYNSRISK